MVEEQETKQIVNQVQNESPTELDKNESNVHSLVHQESSHTLNHINLFDDKQLVVAENLMSRLMKSEKGGIKSVNDGLAILMRAQDLNLPFSSCVEHIHVINGKTGTDIHIIKALLLRAGCTWECLKDYQPLYEYTDGINVYVDGSFPEYVIRCINQKDAEDKATKDKNNNIDDNVYVYPVKWYQDFNGNAYKDYQLNTRQFAIVINKQQAAEVIKSGRIPVYRVPYKPVDFVTEYEISRKVNGKDMKSIGRFTYSDAVQADMFTKDTYKKYPKVLIGHRAFTYAARDIASDILFGVKETTELKIVEGQELTDEDIAEFSNVEVVE